MLMAHPDCDARMGALYEHWNVLSCRISLRAGHTACRANVYTAGCDPTCMLMNHIRRGSGEPLVLVHGLGGSWRTWRPVLDDLAAEREVVAVDLPGHGETPPLSGEVSIDTLADAVTSFLEANDLEGVDIVGNSMGGRLVLELARRGDVGATVALAPGGFWTGWERYFFYATLAPSIRLVRALQPVLTPLTASAVGRTLLLAQLSARPGTCQPTLPVKNCARSPPRRHSTNCCVD